MIRLRTLGELGLYGSDDRELHSVVAQPKRAALLAYLALATPRGAHRRDTLVALFWPEHDSAHARNSLSQSVHVLRHALGASSVVGRDGDALGLDWGELWCDAAAFEEALDGGRAAEAVELYRGELLEGFHIAGAPEFERWLAAERERLARRYMAALEQLANEREAAGDFAGAAEWWRRLVARDPYSSRAALRLMRALATAGDPAAAMRHARLHEALLREELDVAPGREVAALARQLRTAGVAAPSPPPSLMTAASADHLPNAAVAPAAIVTTETKSWSSGRSRWRPRMTILVSGLTLLGAAGAAGAILRARADGRPAPSIRSLAVLPLADLSGDTTEPFFAEGLHDALITELARYPELTVISRTSVERYRGTKMTLPEIARELHVDGVIEGTVMREGSRVRMNAQLARGSSGEDLWAKSYTRDLHDARDVLELQREVAEAIAREVRFAATTRRPPSPPSGDGDSSSEFDLREL